MTEKDNSHPESNASDQSWLDKPSSVNLLIWGLVIVCVLTLVAQLVFPMFDEKHPAHFPGVEDIFGFHAVFGFVAFIVIVYVGRLLRIFVKRPEDYYDS